MQFYLLLNAILVLHKLKLLEASAVSDASSRDCTSSFGWIHVMNV